MPENSPPDRPESEFSNLPEALASRAGHDLVLQVILRHGGPLTVKNYIDVQWWGELPEELDPEDAEFLEALAEYEKSQEAG